MAWIPSRSPTPCIRCGSLRRCNRRAPIPRRPGEVETTRQLHASRKETELAQMADAHAKPHHDYHLVEPSPWPALGSVSAFLMAVGLITWMHHMFAAAPWLFAVGVV